MTEQTTERYCVLVNGHAVEPGCWVEGHWGQYGPDHLADRAEELGWVPEEPARDDPRLIRTIAERIMDENPPEPFCVTCRTHLSYDRDLGRWMPDPDGLIAHAHEPTWPAASAWEAHTESADDIERWLNDHTETEGYWWGWHDGEFYLWPTETWEEEG